jgi:predicted aconitase
MQLTDDERAMAEGRDGPAVARAMDLLLRYGRALGAERLVATNNVVASVSATTPFMREFARRPGGMDAVFSEFSLDSDEVVAVPKVRTFSTHTQLGLVPDEPERMGLDEATITFYRRGEAYISGLGIQATNTCTPYQVGNLPTRGEHCAWMESSAVVYCNSVLGARTNTEGRESVGAAMLTGRIPYWGYHVPENRFGTHRIVVDAELESTADWGVLGYWMGDLVQERVPVVEGVRSIPNLARLKHFGAAASSSGGVEMYHLVGITPEAHSAEAAFGGRAPVETLVFGAAARRATWRKLNATARDTRVDYVMLGCPHYTIEQIWEAARWLEGRKVHPDCELWIFTPRAIKSIADQNGYTKTIEEAGGRLMTDSCSAMSRATPKGTRVVALDSAKQAHYLPAILGLQAWFGSTAECIDAACSGRWRGVEP